MTDLSRFRLGVSMDGDVDLDCLDCFGIMRGVDPASTLAELVALAEAHRCAVVVQGTAATTGTTGRDTPT